MKKRVPKKVVTVPTGELLSPADVKRLLASKESDVLEFKRQWPDLDQAEGKAELAKDILALANTVSPERNGFLIFGVDDERRGAAVVGVQKQPDPEQVTQILSSYVQPPANVQCRHYDVRRVSISILTIAWSAARPHHALRQHPGILATNVVYVRRDRIIGTLTLPEIEAMIREKDARLGPIIAQDPIQFGFVQMPRASMGGMLVARVTNVTTEPIGGVDVVVDIRNARNPELFYRDQRLVNATLAGGESREAEFHAHDITFYLATFDRSTGERKWTSVNSRGYEGDRWFDVTLHVTYRGRDGTLRHLKQTMVWEA